MQLRMAEDPQRRESHAAGEAKKDGDAAQTRQRTGMEMALLGGNRNPSARISEISDVPCQYERRKQGREKQSQTNNSQLRHLDVR